MNINGRLFNITIILFFMVFWASSASSQGWIKVAEIDSTDVYSIIDHNGALYAVTNDEIFKSSDTGETWQPTISKPNVPGIFQTLYSHGSYVYLGTHGDGVFRSSNGGQNWQSLSTGLSGTANNIAGFTALGDSLYAGTDGNGVYVLNLQNPTAWSAFNSGLFQFGVNSIAASGNNIVASVGYYLFVRPRTASQWADVQLDSSGIQRFTYKTLALGQYLYAGTDNGVYRGTLDAQNWQRVDIAAFPNRDILALTAHGSRLLAGLWFSGQHWIFSTDNMGATWDFRAHEFADIWDLFVSGDRLWAGRSDGLWYYDMDVWTGIEEPVSNVLSGYRLGQNYPNPFNPSTTISYTLPKAGYVEIKIYDIRGAEILTLLNEFKNAGTYTVEFDAGTLAGGLYIYKIRAGSYGAAKKMILVK